jgi:hypothetical protein
MKLPLSLVILSLASLAVLGCDKPPTPAVVAPTPAPAADPHAGHDHAADPHAAGGHGDGAVIALGTFKLGTFEVTVTRDVGAITAGGEAAIDATLAGQTANVSAVRFWIGTSDAKGSIKAKAEIEDPTQPNRWHTHAEVPTPLPPNAQVWVEIEVKSGEKLAAAFDLKIS